MIDDQTLLDLFASLSREIGEVKKEMRQGFQRLEDRLRKANNNEGQGSER